MTRKTKILAVSALTGTLLLALLVGTAAAQGGMPWRGYSGWGHGMMGSGYGGWGPGMMGGGMMGSGYGGWGHGMMGGGYGGWGGWSATCAGGAVNQAQCPAWSDTTPGGAPLTMDDAEATAAQYLASYNNDDLQIAEIMQFNQNFYVEVREASTGTGAMELLIDPYTGAIHPEPGPNMMWNTKYGHMAQGGMMGRGMMGGFRLPSGDMTVSADEAIVAAQDWLDANLPGVVAGDEADAFYGYYTIHTLADGAISGMLSVNGYTGQVWYHGWHGDFIDMTSVDEAM